MPKNFVDCVKNKGKVITKTLKGGKYILICYDKDGKSYTSEIKKKKKKAMVNKAKKKDVFFEKEKAQINALLKLKKYFDKKYHN